MSLTKRFIEENDFFGQQENPEVRRQVTECCETWQRYDYEMDEFVCFRCGEEKPVMIDNPLNDKQ